MPINGVLDLQRRSVQIGEIRIGTSVAVEGKKGRKPVRLNTFRFTTASEQAAHAVAAHYGGTVAPWEQRRGRFEVITDRTALDVWVPPRGEAVDANMEAWDGPKCIARCDGLMMSVPARQPCQCPQPDDPADPVSVQRARDERKRLAALRPPQACKPLTRINVTIPDLPGLLGVWRLNTGSESAAVETTDSGDAMAIAREGGVYLPAVLRFEWRTRSADGSPYPVPVLQIGLSMRELSAGALPPGPGGLLAQLQGSSGEGRLAITNGSASTSPRENENGPVTKEAAAWAGMTAQQKAQDIADRAAAAETRAEVEHLDAEAEAEGVGDDHVCTDRAEDVWEELRSVLRARWRRLPGTEAGAA
jgi:hypothetical protein